MTGTPVTLRQFPSELRIPIGSAAGPGSTYLYDHVASPRITVTFGGGEEYSNIYQSAIGYLFEIWDKTVAKGVWQTDSGAQPFTNSAFEIFTASDLRYVQLLLITPPVSIYSTGGDEPMLNIGSVQFTYGGIPGPLQPINFTSQVFFPEFHNADGVLLFFNGNCTGALRVFSGVGDARKIETVPGNYISPSTDDDSGVAAIQSPENNAPFFGGTSFQTPMILAGTLIQQNNKGAGYILDSATGDKSGAWKTALMAYLSEVWQVVGKPELYTDVQPIAIDPGARHYFLNGPFLRKASIQLSAPPNRNDLLYKNSHLKYYGAWAPSIGSAKGKVQYLNADQGYMVTDWTHYDGIWVWLKPGVTGTVQAYTTPDTTFGMTTSAGAVRLEAGETTGLAY